MLDLHQLALERLRPITRLEYERMGELGLFDDERIELLHGMLVQMSPIGVPHSEAVRRLTRLLVLQLGERAWISPQLPYAASDDSMPEPDMAVLSAGDHSREHPKQAHLVIEVSMTSLRKDRRIKAGIYAAGGVTEYWIVNLVDEVIEVHRKPSKGRYTEQASRGRGEVVALLDFPDVSVAVNEVIPQSDAADPA